MGGTIHGGIAYLCEDETMDVVAHKVIEGATLGAAGGAAAFAVLALQTHVPVDENTQREEEL